MLFAKQGSVPNCCSQDDQNSEPKSCAPVLTGFDPFHSPKPIQPLGAVLADKDVLAAIIPVLRPFPLGPLSPVNNTMANSSAVAKQVPEQVPLDGR